MSSAATRAPRSPKFMCDIIILKSVYGRVPSTFFLIVFHCYLSYYNESIVIIIIALIRNQWDYIINRVWPEQFKAFPLRIIGLTGGWPEQSRADRVVRNQAKIISPAERPNSRNSLVTPYPPHHPNPKPLMPKNIKETICKPFNIIFFALIRCIC